MFDLLPDRLSGSALNARAGTLRIRSVPYAECGQVGTGKFT